MRQFSSIACVVSLLAGAGVASATSVNVAILSAIGNTAFENDIKAKITSPANAPFLNIDILDVSSSTPDMATLLVYQAVMVVGNNPFQNSAMLGNFLQQYIDLGHGVVVTASSNVSNVAGGNCPNAFQLCGTFYSGNYWAIKPGQQQGGHATLDPNYLVPNDPLLAGVTSFDGGDFSTRILGAMGPGAIRVANWTDGTPFLATRTFASGAKEVAVNFYPPSSDGYPGLWLSSTDGGKILANAFVVAAGTAGSPDVPEPATYLATATGFGLIALLLKRRRRTLQCDSAQRPRDR